MAGTAGHVGVYCEGQSAFCRSSTVLYGYRAGIAWRDLPERSGDYRVIHLGHSRWGKSLVWQRLCEALACDADNEYGMIDSTIVRADQHSAGAKKRFGVR
ncbi:MAG: hypothetical protein ACRYE9_03630 [Janthinobacterium lividum]